MLDDPAAGKIRALGGVQR